MDPLLLVLLTLAIALGTVRASVPPGARLGLLDVPGERSSHVAPVVRSGGVGVFAALLISGVAWPVFLGGPDDQHAWWRYVSPAALFLGIGFLDDRRAMGAGTKLLLQSIAAAWAVVLGMRWDGGGLGPIPALEFGAATPWMTGLWIVAVVNLINMLDGIDLITCAGAAVMLALGLGGQAGPGDGLLYAAALGAVLALAAWNRAPARVFPGDGGTHLLGFLVATTALAIPGALGAGAHTRGLPWALAAVPLAAGVIDVAWGIASKRRLGLGWTAAHRHSLYHRLTRAGWSHAATAVRYGAVAAVLAFLVGVVAPRAGLGACLAGAALVLGVHLGHGWVIARRVTRAEARR